MMKWLMNFLGTREDQTIILEIHALVNIILCICGT